jgi:hypothetical protein
MAQKKSLHGRGWYFQCREVWKETTRVQPSGVAAWRCLLTLVTHVLLRLIACRMEQGLLAVEHRAEIARVCACRDKH